MPAASAPRWDPQQYLRFADERARPALKLLARVPTAAPAVVYDLGCGAGNVTLLLAERWPAARVTGVDASSEMLAQAAAAPSAVRWIEADLATWQPDEPVDVLYSNATLHWLPDHAALLPRLFATLGPGGCLAIQMPQSCALPSHVLMHETLADVTGRAASAASPVGDPAWYYDLLAPHAATVDVWTTEYLHVLHGDDPVLEWVKGTGLRPTLQRLPDDERRRFLAEYARRLRAAYPRRPDGTTLYPFRRLFVVVTAAMR